MSIEPLDAFSRHLAPGRPVMGLDLGTRTIGVAVSDALRLIASPVVTIKRRSFKVDVQALQALIAERDVAGLVLGWPVEMDGREGSRCQATRAFARNLFTIHDWPVLLWDERLSTAAVQRFLVGEADLSRGKRAQVVDRAAAAYILQGALDALRRGPSAAADDTDF